MATQVFLLTDIEGSTRRWAERPTEMRAALERHDELVRKTVKSAGGRVFKHLGDGMLATFPSVGAAAGAAVSAQRAVAGEDWKALGGLWVRMAVHAGEADARGGDWYGPALNRGARLLAIGHGGQVLLSDAARALTVDDPQRGLVLVDLGIHRLRDLLQPERVWQVTAEGLRQEFPPLRSLDAFHGNLPTQLTPFVGRDVEVGELVEALSSQRLTTLVGAGGMGKTRLALEVAASSVDKFPDGAWMVELAPVTKGEAVDHAVAVALGVEPRLHLTPLEAVTRALATWRALVVMDNCEHVLTESASLISSLLMQCPGVVVLATSREPLHLVGERVWLIGPLDAEREAVELFADRAAAVRRGFELTDAVRPIVAGICRRLDGMPLAIELAAGRTRSMTPAELADRLDERFRLLGAGRSTLASARHATLAAVVDWSYDLLTPAEQVLLCRLSVFAGGFDLDAAHHVCSDAADELAMLDLLDALVERSLVVAEENDGRTRYRMLETIRQYGADRLEADEADAIRRRHVDCYASLLRSGRRRSHSRWLEQETDNLRVAVAYAISNADVDVALSIVGRLWSHVYSTLRLIGAEDWAAASLGLPGATESADARWTYVLMSVCRFVRADYAAAEAHARTALVVEERLGLRPESRVLVMLSVALAFQGRYREGYEAAAQAAEVAAQQGRVRDQVEALYDLIQWTVHDDRDPDEDVVAEVMRVAEASEDPVAITTATYAAGIAATRTDPQRAIELLRLSQAMANRVGLSIFALATYAYIPVFEHPNDPALALQGLADILNQIRHQDLPSGMMRPLIRDYVRAFGQLGRQETVAVLDGASAAITQAPAWARQAVEEARAALGRDAYDAAWARGHSLVDNALEAFLRTELDHIYSPNP